MERFEELIEKLEGIKITVISGVFLALSFALSLMEIHFPIDPAWVTVFLSGLPLLFSAVRKLVKNRGISKISSALLISTAMLAAITIGDLFAAGEVAFIMAVGELLEDKTTEKARKGLKKLISLTPTTGRIIRDGKEAVIPAEQITVGDILRILPGETIPVDGEIISGETSVDQSVVTGESLPIDKTVGDGVFCGTVNRFGSIDIKATRVGEDSSLQKLIRMVKEAEDKKAPMQRVADKWASILVPVALLLAIVALIATKDIVRAVTVLVVFCPCALVLATPTAIMAAIGQAAKYGVIIKSGEALENMGKTDAVAFDKTGTVTKGVLGVCDIFPLDESITENTLLELTASAESKSEHPLGKAIVSCARLNGVTVKEPQVFAMSVGKGIRAILDHSELLCGSARYLAENGVVISQTEEEILNSLNNDGKAAVITAKDGVCIGIIALSDELKAECKSAVRDLSDIGVNAVLLTGDNRNSAGFFAEKAGIKTVYSELLPEDKVKAIVELQAGGRTVCMVGDGVNDAPALKTADVGVAMGGMGSDISVEAADIAIINDDISRVAYLKKLSVETVKTIKFSIFLSLFINFVAIILSFTGTLTPTTGALVHNAGSVFVVLIAALLYERKI